MGRNSRWAIWLVTAVAILACVAFVLALVLGASGGLQILSGVVAVASILERLWMELSAWRRFRLGDDHPMMQTMHSPGTGLTVEDADEAPHAGLVAGPDPSTSPSPTSAAPDEWGEDPTSEETELWPDEPSPAPGHYDGEAEWEDHTAFGPEPASPGAFPAEPEPDADTGEFGVVRGDDSESPALFDIPETGDEADSEPTEASSLEDEDPYPVDEDARGKPSLASEDFDDISLLDLERLEMLTTGIVGPDFSPVPEPPRSSHALLKAPEAVVMQQRFDVEVGLAAEPVEGVYSEEMHLPDSVRGSYVLTVHVVADGFSLEEGDDWQVELPVTSAKPYPTAKLRLVAESQHVPVRARAVRALFSINGQTIGMALRPIAVAQSPMQVLAAVAEVETEAGFAVTGPPGPGAPDLEVCIVHGKEEHAGRLVWTFKTPHQGIAVPREGVVCDIGEKPDAFGRRLVKKMPSCEGNAGLYAFVAGVGDTVNSNVPREMWALLSEVARRKPEEVPSVLFVSEEPHVPWELALMRAPLRSEDPPFLCAQARVGRWVFPNPNTDRPTQPPPSVAAAASMAVVAGVYDQPGWRRLKEAELEATDLESAYGAHAVNADTEAVLKCIEGDPKADILHFAVHGQYDPDGLEDGLVLVDGRVLDPLQVRGTEFPDARFVFLNACQVGSGSEVLGDYAGMAAAFLHQGAAAVIAPLWSIDDALARELALEFYAASFAGTSPAELLRRKRADFTKALKPVSSTFMAYQFFGHPDMKFEHR